MKTIKEDDTITKQTIKVGDLYIAYERRIYDERIYKVKVTEVNGVNVKLECKWVAYSGGYDFGMSRHFRVEKNDRVWTFEGKIYKGKVTKKGEYSNTVYKLMRMDKFASSVDLYFN